MTIYSDFVYIFFMIIIILVDWGIYNFFKRRRDEKRINNIYDIITNEIKNNLEKKSYFSINILAEKRKNEINVNTKIHGVYFKYEISFKCIDDTEIIKYFINDLLNKYYLEYKKFLIYKIDKEKEEKNKRNDDEYWWDVLGLKEGASEKEINEKYRLLAKKYHPDAGGSAELMIKISEAKKKAIMNSNKI